MKLKKLFYCIFFTILISSIFIRCSSDNDDNTGNRKEYDNGYYVGEFNKKGQRHGQGIYYWNSGEKYEGTWKNDEFEGYGEMTYSNSTYKGYWVNGNKEGKGIYRWNSGAIYDGEWKEDDHEGYGEMTYESGNIYKGYWVKNNKEGEGTYFWVSGNKYEGGWKENNRSGNGTFTFKDGSTFTCAWKEGNPTEEKCYFVYNYKYWYYLNSELGNIDVNNYSSAEEILEKTKNRSDKQSNISEIPSQTDHNTLFFEGKELGFGFGMRWDKNNILRVAWVFDNSPAGISGAKRGWTISHINGKKVADMTAIPTNTTTQEGISRSFTFINENNQSQEMTLSSGIYRINSILHHQTIHKNTEKIGYLVLKSFIKPNADEILNKTKSIINTGIDELILDLRYCSGGNHALLNEFAGLIAPASTTGKTLMKRQYNQDYSDRDTSYIIKKEGNLNLKRLFVLTTGSTANIPEYLISGFTPLMNVISIGQTTYDSFHLTSSWTFNEKKRHTLFTSIMVNSKNESGKVIPTHYTTDSPDKQWGDEKDNLLKNAISFITTGQFVSDENPLEIRTGINILIEEEINPAESDKLSANKEIH